MAAPSKTTQIARLALGSAAGLMAAVLQSGPAQAALKTTNFVWNGTGTVGVGSGSPYQMSGVFTYDDSQPFATITPDGSGPGGYGSTSTGFTNFIIQQILVAGSPINGLPATVVNAAGSVVNSCTGTGCSFANNITFNTATQAFVPSVSTGSFQQVLAVESSTDFLVYGDAEPGLFTLAFNGGEDIRQAESTTGLAFVPGPLPIVGASMAWGWSRRLRKRVKLSSSQPPSTLIS